MALMATFTTDKDFNKRDIFRQKQLERIRNRDLMMTARRLGDAKTAAEEYGNLIALAAKRFGAYALGAISLRKVIGAYQDAWQAAIKFDDTMVRVGQVHQKER